MVISLEKYLKGEVSISKFIIFVIFFGIFKTFSFFFTELG